MGERLFADINRHWSLLPEGTIVDASIIAVVDRAGPRDHQTKKGNEWHFGMKVHVGVDAETGVVHSVTTTPANVNDVTEAHRPYTVERCGCGAMRGIRESTSRRIWRSARGRSWTWKRGFAGREEQSMITKVEHPFLCVKRHFGYAKVRYRGLYKNRNGWHCAGAGQPDDSRAALGSEAQFHTCGSRDGSHTAASEATTDTISTPQLPSERNNHA